jgi:hypothetical protein
MNATISTSFICALYVLITSFGSAMANSNWDVENNILEGSWGGDVWVDERGATCFEHSENYLFVSCVREQFYDVEGNSLFDIQVSMEKNSPIEGFLGKSDTHMGWSFDAEGQCSAIVDTLIVLPKLLGKENLSIPLQKKWDKFSNAIRKHENNHRLISVLGYWEEFNKNCPAPDKAASKIQSRQDKYDDHTNHGKTEGAFWN